MTNREFYISRRKIEVPTFIKVLKAMPGDRLDYRPHPKSRSAAELAWLIAAEEAVLVTLPDTGIVDWKEEPAPASVEKIVAVYERSAAAIDERLAKLDDAAWEKKAAFQVNGATAWEDAVGQFFWGFLFDVVHHRGQLSTYLRPMGGKVPAIYGPTADDPGQ